MYLPANLTLQAANLVLSLMPTSFGASISNEIKGHLSPIMLYDPNSTGANLGCLSLRTYELGFSRKDPASLPSPPQDWIALIQRGRCSFIEKIRFAQELGAKAVIIGNDAANTETHGQTFKMGDGGHGSGDLVIPAYGMTGKEYEDMVYRLEHGQVALNSEDFKGLEVVLTPHAVEMATPPSSRPIHKVESQPKKKYPSDAQAIWTIITTFVKVMSCVLLVIGVVGVGIVGIASVITKIFGLDSEATPTEKTDAHTQAPLLGQETKEKAAEVEQEWEKVVREE